MFYSYGSIFGTEILSSIKFEKYRVFRTVKHSATPIGNGTEDILFGLYQCLTIIIVQRSDQTCTLSSIGRNLFFNLRSVTEISDITKYKGKETFVDNFTGKYLLGRANPIDTGDRGRF